MSDQGASIVEVGALPQDVGTERHECHSAERAGDSKTHRSLSVCEGAAAVSLGDLKQAASPEDSYQFVHSLGLVRPVLDRRNADRCVEMVIGEGQLQGRADLKVDLPMVFSPDGCPLDLVGRKIHAGDSEVGCALGQLEYELASATSDIEDRAVWRDGGENSVDEG